MFFSVVIPTYNRRQQIGEAIDSALAQQDAQVQVEVIVVDDRSTDDTITWLRTTYVNEPVHVLTNDRSKGPAGGRNCGMLAARGDAIAFLDSDDAFLPGHLAACAQLLDARSEVGVVFGPARYEQGGQEVDYMGPNFALKLAQAPVSVQMPEATIFTRDYFAHLLQFGCYFNLSSVVLRVESGVRPLMTEALRIAEDFEFWVRLARTRTYACLKQPQIRYQLHDDNISFEATATSADHAPMLLKAYGLMADYPNMGPRELAIVHGHMAQVLFDWAYRCRQRGEYTEALRQHMRSMRHGARLKNLMALAKLPLFALMSLRSRSARQMS